MILTEDPSFITMEKGNIKELLAYLVNAPRNFQYKWNDKARNDLKRALFKSASMNGKYITSFFPFLGEADEETAQTLLKEAYDPDAPDSPLNWSLGHFNGKDSKVDPSHPGRPCVRKFKKGEPTYRCL